MANYMDKNLQVPNYSGVNIQIFNPAVNTVPQQGALQQNSYPTTMESPQVSTQAPVNSNAVAPAPWATIPQGSVYNNNNQVNNNIQYPQAPQGMQQPAYMAPYPYQMPYPAYYPQPITNPQTESNKLDIQTEKKKVVVLTDDYIRSLENYLNNSNREIRLQAAQDIVKRFEEDSSRFDDPALNALLNKMLQDPQGSIRGIALSLITTGSAQGNNYTAQLLNTMQHNQNNKEDALQAAEALLRMATKTETIDVIKQLPTEKAGSNGNNS